MSTDRPALEYVAVSGDPRWGRHRSAGSDERRVEERLAGVRGVLVVPPPPGGHPGPDRLAVGHSGVFVVHTGHFHRTDVSVHRTGGIFGPVREQLMVGGHDRTSLVHAALARAEAVRARLGPDHAPFPVRAVVCLVDALFPLLPRLEIGGVRVVGLRGLGRLVGARGPVDATARAAVARSLAERPAVTVERDGTEDHGPTTPREARR